MSDSTCQTCMGAGTISIKHPTTDVFRDEACPVCSAAPGVTTAVDVEGNLHQSIAISNAADFLTSEQAIRDIEAYQAAFNRVKMPEFAIVDPIGLANPPLVVSDGVLPETTQCIDVTPALTSADINAQQVIDMSPCPPMTFGPLDHQGRSYETLCPQNLELYLQLQTLLKHVRTCERKIDPVPFFEQVIAGHRLTAAYWDEKAQASVGLQAEAWAKFLAACPAAIVTDEDLKQI